MRRLKNESFAAMKNMKIRLLDIHPFDLVQTLKEEISGLNNEAKKCIQLRKDEQGS